MYFQNFKMEDDPCRVERFGKIVEKSETWGNIESGISIQSVERDTIDE